jgi:hypothetical protein
LCLALLAFQNGDALPGGVELNLGLDLGQLILQGRDVTSSSALAIPVAASLICLVQEWKASFEFFYKTNSSRSTRAGLRPCVGEG